MPTMKYGISMNVLTIEVPSWRRPSWMPRQVSQRCWTHNAPKSSFQRLLFSRCHYRSQWHSPSLWHNTAASSFIRPQTKLYDSLLPVTTTEKIKKIGVELEERQHLGTADLEKRLAQNSSARIHSSPLHMNDFAPPSLPPKNLTLVSKL